MKAITPVIALVMLLLITVGIVGASYTWFGGLMSSQTKKSITIPPGGAYCADGDIKVYVLNNGDTTITASDIVVAQVDGVDIKNTPFFGDMRSNLVGYWKFDETTGTAAYDSSGVVPPNTGTLNGNPQRVVGKSRNALKFDVLGQHVSATGFALKAPTTDITISAWVNAATFSGQHDLFWMTGGGDERITVHFPWENLIIWQFGPTPYVGCVVNIGSIGMTTNTWYNLVFTAQSTPKTSKIYVNGVQQCNNPDANSYVQRSGDWLIGGRTGNTFIGMIDEIKIYNKAAGSANIQPGQSSVIVNYPGVKGRHTIRVATPTNAAEATVNCA